MTDWKATTETGAIYRRGNGNLYVKGTYYHNGVIRSIPVDVVEAWREASAIDWDYIRSLPTVEIPVVGEHIYASALKEWRLSTPVVSVEMTERRVPMQGGPGIPRGTITWSEHLEIWDAYHARYGNQQDAERIAQRGGFGYRESVTLTGHKPATWEKA